MSRSKIFLCSCLGFIAGIFVDSLVAVPPVLSAMLLFLAIGLILFSGQRRLMIVSVLIFLAFTVGVFRHQEAQFRFENNLLNKLNGLDGDVRLTGIVNAEPEMTPGHMKLVVNVKKAEWANNSGIQSAELRGKVLVTVNRYSGYQYGDEIKITGKLKSPPVFEGFNYQAYLQKDGVHSVIYWPEIELISRGGGNPVMARLLYFKSKFQETIRMFLAPPQSGILEALVFGEESDIPSAFRERLNITATRHITAVSGMNVTIIAFLVLSFMLGLGLWRRQAFVFSLAFVFFYVLMVGLSSSAVRAGIMGSFLMTGQYLGRLNSAAKSIVFAAAIMLLHNPFLLTLDIGFQLSFLAVLGIIYLQPLLSELFKSVPNPNIFPVKTTISATLGAQVFVLPILIYNFGTVSWIAPFTNLLIVPFLAPFTIFFFIFGVAGMVLLPLGYLFSLPAWFFLTYIVVVVKCFSELPMANMVVEDVPWILPLCSYAALGWCIWWLRRRKMPYGF